GAGRPALARLRGVLPPGGRRRPVDRGRARDRRGWGDPGPGRRGPAPQRLPPGGEVGAGPRGALDRRRRGDRAGWPGPVGAPGRAGHQAAVRPPAPRPARLPARGVRGSGTVRGAGDARPGAGVAPRAVRGALRRTRATPPLASRLLDEPSPVVVRGNPGRRRVVPPL